MKLFSKTLLKNGVFLVRLSGRGDRMIEHLSPAFDIISFMKVAVILGSIRDIRRGGRVAKWLMPQLEQFKNLEFELLDPNDYPLPFFNESDSPEGLGGNYSNTVAKKWSAKVAEKDAFIVVTPEYNHGTSAVLKNSLDWLYYEWVRKPIAFISYSPNAAGGVRAVEQLRQNVIELQMAPLREAIHITYVLDTLDEEGKVLRGHFNERLEVLISELTWWAKALKSARDQDEPTHIEDRELPESTL